MTDINELRKYRFKLEHPFFNSNSDGIALFDLSISFLTAYILDYLFNISSFISCKNKKQTYYLLIIPFGILIHHLFAHYKSNIIFGFPEEITFLNKKLFTTEFNIYQVLILALLYYIGRSC